MPHIQLDATPAFKGKSAGGLYGDVIEEIDWSVGEVLAALNRAGLDDKTLVIFTSDNGPWLAMKDQGGSALPLRDGKFSVFEGGMRVPCLMRWQGKIPPGRVSSELCATIDLLPTVARLAGGKLPAARVRDGKDIWPLLSGRAGARSPHKAFFYHQAGNLLAVRGGKWKLHLAREEGERGVFGGNRPAAPAYLYDLEADVGERHDLAADHRDLVEQFTHLARRFQQELAATSRPPGKLSGK
jgi:arylsulfatase A-like enzyme